MEIIKSLFYDYWKNILIAILLLLLLTSCGSRKVQKSVVKDSFTTEQATTENKDIEKVAEARVLIDEQTNEIEIIPIDTAKVMIINGKEFKNGKVRIITKQVKTDISEKETFTDKSKKTNNVKTNTVKKNLVKKTERKSNPLWNLLWLLIPIFLFALYLKYKGKLWWL